MAHAERRLDDPVEKDRKKHRKEHRDNEDSEADEAAPPAPTALIRLRDLPGCSALTVGGSDRKIFWTAAGSAAVRRSLQYFNNILATPNMRGEGQTTTLWDHLTRASSGWPPVGVVQGCGGTGKTMSLLHHIDPNVVVFYLHLPEINANAGAELQKLLDGKPADGLCEAAVTALVVDGVWDLLGKTVRNPSDEDKVLVAVDDAGVCRRFTSSFVAARAEIVSGIRKRCFNGAPIPIRLAVSGRGLELRNVPSCAEGRPYVLLEPCPNVWEAFCAGGR